jgi:hypothetical protein
MGKALSKNKGEKAAAAEAEPAAVSKIIKI